MTLREILNSKSNNYNKLESLFKSKTGQELLSKEDFKYPDLKAGLSIVIPSYNANNTLPLTLSSIEENIKNIPKGLIEVLVIDDGSDKPVYSIVKSFEAKMDINYYKHNKNLGLGPTRREGVKLTKHKNVIFLDADVLLSKNFIKNHLIAYNVLPNKAMFVSLQEIAPRSDVRVKNYKQLKLKDIDFQNKDFRGYVKVQSKWNPPKEEIDKVYSLLKDTNYFKDFGKGKKVGLWTLPMMAVGHSMGAPRLNLMETGGAPEGLKGAGWNDTSLGARAIGNGLYIIPLLNSAVIQIKHEVRLGNYAQKRKSFVYNRKVYERMLDREFQIHKFDSSIPI